MADHYVFSALADSVLTCAAGVGGNIDRHLGIGIGHDRDVGFLFNATAIIAASRQAVIGLEIGAITGCF